MIDICFPHQNYAILSIVAKKTLWKAQKPLGYRQFDITRVYIYI